MSEQVERLLLELGNTADEVAAKLAAKGIRGERNMAHSCPISNYVMRCLSLDGSVFTDEYEVSVLGDPTPSPPPVTNFVFRFDGGDFDGLVY